MEIANKSFVHWGGLVEFYFLGKLAPLRRIGAWNPRTEIEDASACVPWYLLWELKKKTNKKKQLQSCYQNPKLCAEYLCSLLQRLYAPRVRILDCRDPFICLTSGTGIVIGRQKNDTGTETNELRMAQLIWTAVINIQTRDTGIRKEAVECLCGVNISWFQQSSGRIKSCSI